jgi:hypothetical protein
MSLWLARPFVLKSSEVLVRLRWRERLQSWGYFGSGDCNGYGCRMKMHEMAALLSAGAAPIADSSNAQNPPY